MSLVYIFVHILVLLVFAIRAPLELLPPALSSVSELVFAIVAPL